MREAFECRLTKFYETLKEVRKKDQTETLSFYIIQGKSQCSYDHVLHLWLFSFINLFDLSDLLATWASHVSHFDGLLRYLVGNEMSECI